MPRPQLSIFLALGLLFLSQGPAFSFAWNFTRTTTGKCSDMPGGRSILLSNECIYAAQSMSLIPVGGFKVVSDPTNRSRGCYYDTDDNNTKLVMGTLSPAAESCSDDFFCICFIGLNCSITDGSAKNSMPCICGDRVCTDKTGLICFDTSSGGSCRKDIYGSFGFTKLLRGKCSDKPGRRRIKSAVYCAYAAKLMGYLEEGRSTVHGTKTTDDEPVGCNYKHKDDSLTGTLEFNKGLWGPGRETISSSICFLGVNCSITDGSGESSIAPCICGSEICTEATGLICFVHLEEGSCRKHFPGPFGYPQPENGYCTHGSLIEDNETCAHAAYSVMGLSGKITLKDESNNPEGCYIHGGEIFYNVRENSPTTCRYRRCICISVLPCTNRPSDILSRFPCLCGSSFCNNSTGFLCNESLGMCRDIDISVYPTSLVIKSIETVGDNNGPSIRLSGTIPPYKTSVFSTVVAFARIVVYHVVTQESASIIARDQYTTVAPKVGDYILNALMPPITNPTDSNVQIDGVSNWTFESNISLRWKKIGAYVGVIPLTVSVEACAGEGKCGIPVTILTPLKILPSPPLNFSVKQATGLNYALNLTWSPSLFKGPFVYTNASRGRYTIEQRRINLLEAWAQIRVIDTRDNHFVTPNGLLGKGITSYIYRINVQYIHTDGSWSQSSEFVQNLNAVSASSAEMPILEPPDYGDQIPTKENNELIFLVGANSWTGAPIMNFSLRWKAEDVCGPQATNLLNVPWTEVEGPGILSTAASNSSEKFRVKVPASLEPETKYHLQVRAVWLSGIGNDAQPQLSTSEATETFILQTLQGTQNVSISDSDGDDSICASNLTALASKYPCKTISFAMRSIKFRVEYFEYIVYPGNYEVGTPLTFAKRYMKLVSQFGLVEADFSNATIIYCKSRCIDINTTHNEVFPPSLIKGLYFKSLQSPNSSRSHKGGAILVAHMLSTGLARGSQNYDLTIEYCKFEGFSALLYGGAFYIVNVAARLRIADIIFLNNAATTGYGGGMSIDTSTDVTVSDVQCFGNSAMDGGCLSVTNLYEDDFTARPSRLSVTHLTSVGDRVGAHGGALFISRSSTVTLKDSLIQNASGFGAVYVDAANKITLSNVSILNTIYAFSDAAQIVCVASPLYISQDSEIGTLNPNNIGLRGLKSTGCSVSIENSRFYNNFVDSDTEHGAAMLLMSYSTLQILNSRFESNIARRGDGGAIACLECLTLSIETSTFERNIAARGGALFLHKPPSGISLISVLFSSNTAQFGGGGAIYRFGDTELGNMGSVIFRDNVAKYGMQRATDPIKIVATRSSNTAVSNNVEIKDIVVRLHDRIDNIVRDDTLTVVVTANSLSEESPVTSLRRSTDIESSSGMAVFDFLLLNGKPGEHNIQFSALVNGKSLTTKLRINIAACEAGEELTTQQQGGYICRKCSPGFFIGKGTTCLPCKAGTFAAAGSSNCTACTLGKVMRPGDQTLCFTCQKGTYSLKPGSIDDGNVFQDTLIPPLARCRPCPEGATCGEGLIVAKSGWWRPKPKNKDVFYKCKASTACLGAPNELFMTDQVKGKFLRNTTFNETCAQGYTGRLCHRCIAKWSRDGADLCKPCLVSGSDAIVLALLGMMAVFLAFGAFIYNSMNTTLDDPTNTTITMKIATSHLQVLAIASAMPFRWPQVTKNMFRAFDVVSSVSEDVINLECVFVNEADRTTDNSVAYQTTVMILVGPFVFVIFASLFWTMSHLCKRCRFAYQAHVLASAEPDKGPTNALVKSKPTCEETRNNIIVSVIVVMVLVHPTLTRRSVQLLTCDKIGEDDKRYLRLDLEIICWEGAHMAWALIVIPFLIICKFENSCTLCVALFEVLHFPHENILCTFSLLFWDTDAFGIPFLSLFVMYRRKHKLHYDKQTASRYGFLYLGYTKRAWYWEAIVMLRKVFMVMIDVLLGPSGVAVQSLFCLLMLSIMFFITLRVTPFEEPHVALLEYLSLITSFVTLWMGSFFWASPENQDLAVLLSVLIVLINVIFLLYLIVVSINDTFKDYKIVAKLKGLTVKVNQYLRKKWNRKCKGRFDDRNISSSTLDVALQWPDEGNRANTLPYESGSAAFQTVVNPMELTIEMVSKKQKLNRQVLD